LNRHSLIIKANSPCARSHATPPSVSMRRYVICVAARRVSPCRTVKAALVQCNLEDLDISLQFRFLAGPRLGHPDLSEGLCRKQQLNSITTGSRFLHLFRFGLYSRLACRIAERQRYLEHPDNNSIFLNSFSYRCEYAFGEYCSSRKLSPANVGTTK
jgi:hypothetical protein